MFLMFKILLYVILKRKEREKKEKGLGTSTNGTTAEAGT